MPIVSNTDGIMVPFVTSPFHLKSNYDEAKVLERKTCGGVQDCKTAASSLNAIFLNLLELSITNALSERH